MHRHLIAAVAAVLLVGCAQTPEIDCDAPGVVCTLAGVGEASFSGDGGSAREAGLYGPMDVAFAPDGDYFVIVDWNNHKLRTVRDGTIETIIGTLAPLEGAGLPEPGGTPGPELGINHPSQAEFGPDGALYIAGWHNHRILRWDPDTGIVTRVSGVEEGFAGDGGPALDANLAFPTSLAFSADGGMYFVDQGNARVRTIGPDGTIGTVAGTGELGLEGDGGSPSDANFAFAEMEGMQNIPAGALEMDEDGVIWVADSFNGCLRRIDMLADLVESPLDGLDAPRDLEVGPDGRLYVLDTHNHVVRAFDRETGASEVVVGTGDSGFGVDGTDALDFDLGLAHGLEFAPDGAMIVSDTYNHRIVRVAPGF